MTSSDILDLIARDERMMRVIQSVASLELPDWAIGAGFVRNKVWDHMHGYAKSTAPSDIDVVYFDPKKEHNEKVIEGILKHLHPDLAWEVVNQATVHPFNNDAPYKSTLHAIAHWPETATAIGVTVKNGALALLAPYGVDDLANMIVRPTPIFASSKIKMERYGKRRESKRWSEKWPKTLTV